MIKKTALFLLCFVSIAQAQESQNLRKGKFHFNGGLEYRITPYYDLPTISQSDIVTALVDVDLQNAGMGLNIGAEFFVTNNFSIGFSNIFRYDHIVSGISGFNEPDGVRANKYGLLIDYNLFFNYYFKVFNKGDFFVNAGFSRVNTNSDVSTLRPLFDQNGNPTVSVLTNENFSYWANRFELGYASNKAKLCLGVMMSQNTDYFDESTFFLVPFARFSLKLGEL